MLKKRHFEILNKINQDVNLEELSNIFNVTERSLRYYIDEINEVLCDEKIKIKKRIVTSNISKSDLEKLMTNLKIETYNFTQNERIELIIFYTLLKDKEFYLNDLIETLNVSKSTIRLDIKKLQEILKPSNIKLCQTKKKFYYDYSEKDLIYFATNFLYKYVKFNEENDELELEYDDYFNKIIYSELKKDYFSEMNYIYKRIKSIDFNYMDETIYVLVILMSYSRKRNKQIEKSLNLDNIEILRKREDYAKLKKYFPDFTETEILFFTDYLFRISRDNENVLSRFNNWFEIVCELSKIGLYFEKQFGIRQENTLRLIKELELYIKPLIFRSRTRLNLKNSILKDVKILYLNTFNFVRPLFYNLEKIINADISENEIASIIPLFQKALDTKTENKDEMILVTSYKENIANFLKDNLEEEFNVKIKKIYSYKKFITDLDNGKKFNNISIVSTSEIKIECKDMNILTVNPILTEQDIKKLENFGLVRNNKIKISNLLSIIEKYASSIKTEKLIEEIKDNFSDRIIDDLDYKTNILKNYLNDNSFLELNSNNYKEAILNIAKEYIDKEIFDTLTIEKLIDNIEKRRNIFFLNNQVAVIYMEDQNIDISIVEPFIKIAKFKNKIKINNRKVSDVVFFYSSNNLKVLDFINAIVRMFEKDL